MLNRIALGSAVSQRRYKYRLDKREPAGNPVTADSATGGAVMGFRGAPVKHPRQAVLLSDAASVLKLVLGLSPRYIYKRTFLFYHLFINVQ